MKKLLAFTLGILFVGALVAQTVTFTETSHFWRFQCDAQYDASGNVTAAPTQAFYQTTVVSSAGTTFPGPNQTVSWDAIATATTPISITLADGTTATTTRGALLKAIIAVADQVRTTPPATSGATSSGLSTTSSSTSSTSSTTP